MLFNSLQFLVFLPIVFLLYWFVFGPYRLRCFIATGDGDNKLATWWTKHELMLQNLLVVVASYVFYGWWDWRFLLLIAFTSLCSWLSGLLIERAEITPPHHDLVVSEPLRSKKAKFYLWANILLNLGILAIFKYYNFFVDSFVEVFATVGISLHASTLQIILPVGISFYTFQALSYSIDVYKGKIAPTHDIVAFFAFVSFFPQLVAGPIERATNLLPQFQKKRTFDYEKASDGCRQMLWGFFKKIVIADTCALFVNDVWNNYTAYSGFALIVAAVLFTFQIYGDFSGYSDIAIGCAKLFGIELKRNFNLPYFSRDIAEFWRRWHISLTTWFRDYIYIPLGGSRTTKAKVIRNTFIIFLTSGLWHGANWTFVAWGAYHALLFLPLILLGKNRKYTNIVAIREDGSLRWYPTLLEIGQMCLTFGLAVIGWIIFRAESISQAWGYVSRIFHKETFLFDFVPTIRVTKETIILIFCMLVIEWFTRNKEHGLAFLGNRHWLVRYAVYVVFVLLLAVYYSPAITFIYFQF